MAVRTKARKKQTKTFGSRSNEECLQEVMRLYHEQGEIAQTLRHYYYLLIPDFIQIDPAYPKSKKNGYKFVSRILTIARKRGLIPWNAVTDPGRRNLGMSQFSYDDIDEYVRLHSKPYYHLDPWRGQPGRILIGVEADGMLNMVSGWVSDYRMGVFVAKGYSSTTINKELAEHMGTGKGWSILYCGDFDPTGLDIERNIKDQLRDYGCRPDIERVALLHADVDELTRISPEKRKIPPPDDSRTKKFVAQYGPDQMCFDLETMRADRLRQRLLTAIQLRMDVEKFNEAVRLENEVNAHAPDLGKLMQDYGDTILRGMPLSRLSREEQLLYFQKPREPQEELEEQRSSFHWEWIDGKPHYVWGDEDENDQDDQDDQDEEDDE